jgi:hypothetical protein
MEEIGNAYKILTLKLDEFPEQLIHYLLSKKNSAPWSSAKLLSAWSTNMKCVPRPSYRNRRFSIPRKNHDIEQDHLLISVCIYIVLHEL